MYPFEDGDTYPRNQWYIAACSHEVGRALFERRILDEPILLYRTEAGEPVAMDGICPHRNLPLIQGTLEGDSVRCGYHGFLFDADGRCSDIPSQDSVPASFCTRVYPVIERWQWIWVWMGDPALADERLLPDMAAAGLGEPGWRGDNNGVRLLKARYALLIDNLMDLSHIAFLHLRTIGKSDVALAAAEITDRDGKVRVSRTLHDQPVEGLHRFLHPHCDGPVTVTLYSEFLGVGLINAAGPHSETVDGTPVGKMNFVHGMTPETPTTTHYFPAVSRNFRLDDEGLSQALLMQESAVIDEDIAGLEHVELAVRQRGDTRRELSVLADAGAVRVRRRVIAILREDARGPATKG